MRTDDAAADQVLLCDTSGEQLLEFLDDHRHRHRFVAGRVEAATDDDEGVAGA